MKVLLLNAPYGNGHKYCSKAIKIGLEDNNVDVIELDFYESFCNPGVVKISKEFHKNSFTWWGKRLYKIGFVASDKFFLPEISTKRALGKNNLEEFILLNEIKKVVITFPIAAVFPLSKKLKDVDFYEVVTDFSMHKKWQNPHVKAIFVGSSDLARQNPQLDNIVVSGIPIIKREIDVKKVNNFKGAQKTISIILGASGIIKSKLDFIDKIAKSYKINIICGKNKDLFDKLSAKYDNKENIFVWGFVTEIQNLYMASDLIITKSGGMTCSELINYRTKALFFKPQYGQERDNALFFEKYNLGMIIKDHNSINRQISFMLNIKSDFDAVYIENSNEIICKRILKNEN